MLKMKANLSSFKKLARTKWINKKINDGPIENVGDRDIRIRIFYYFYSNCIARFFLVPLFLEVDSKNNREI